MDFPTIVYRTPGEHRGPNASTYDWLAVADEGVSNAALSDGWHPSMEDAFAVKTTKGKAG